MSRLTSRDFGVVLSLWSLWTLWFPSVFTTEDTEGTESRKVRSFWDMDGLIAEPVDAPNPAIALLFQVGRHWRGVGDPCRSATWRLSM